MDLSKLNGNTFEKVFDDVENIKDYPFVKKEESKDVYIVKSVYLTKGNYGYQSNFILENPKARISFANRSYFDLITSDKELINAIKQGKMTLHIEKYFNQKYKKDCFKPYFEVIPF